MLCARKTYSPGVILIVLQFAFVPLWPGRSTAFAALPQDLAATASEGVSQNASREDHVHSTNGVAVIAKGLVEDGTTDNSATLQTVLNANAGNTVLIQRRSTGRMRFASQLNVPDGTSVVGIGNPNFFYDFSNSTNPALLNLQGCNQTVEGIWFDGTGRASAATTNGYCIRVAGVDTGHRTGICVRNCRFTNLDTNYYVGTKPGTSQVYHAVYMDYVDNGQVTGCTIDTISGAAVFARHCSRLNVINNDINNTGWYSIHLDGDNHHWEIASNRITGTDPNCRYWGPSIDIMGQVGYGSDTHGSIHHNYVTGVHSYGWCGAVSLRSSDHVDVHDNDFYQVQNACVIRTLMRQVVGYTNGAAPKHINVHDNKSTAWGAGQVFCYSTDGTIGGGTGTIEKAVSLQITGNIASSVDSSNYFKALAIVHAQDGGYDNITIANNFCNGSPDYNILGGMIGIAGNSGTPARYVDIHNNQLVFYNGVGAATNSSQAGVLTSTAVDYVQVKDNLIQGFWHGIRAVTGSGPNLWLHPNQIAGSVSMDLLIDSGISEQPMRVAKTGLCMGPQTGVGGDDTFIQRGATGAATVPMLIKSGVPTDADFASTPSNGVMAVNTATSPPTLYCRIGGVWTQIQ